MSTPSTTDADRKRMASLLNRLQTGDKVTLRTNTNVPTPRTFTVESTGKERYRPSNRLFYRVHLTGPDGGNYVVYPNDRPDWNNSGEVPELYHISPEQTTEWDEHAERSAGNIRYVKLEAGTPS